MKKQIQLLIFGILLLTACQEEGIPLVYALEKSYNSAKELKFEPIEALTAIETLPDPLLFADGKKRVSKFKEWPKRRDEIIQLLQHYELGWKPVTPKEKIQASLENDTLIVNIQEGGETLQLKSHIIYPETGEGPFPLMIGIGLPTGSLPKELFDGKPIARMGFGFWQVMSHTQKRGEEPINRLYPNNIEIGAYAAWPWGVSRLIDGLEMVAKEAQIDLKHIGITGCSFAGKMALYAGALDERIALTIAQEPGGGGVNAWRVSETLGHVETLERTNYAWFLESMKQFAKENVKYLPIDHHEVAALIAPRALLVLGNPDYEWLAEESNYVSCRAAREVWKAFGIEERMGYSIEANHMHCMLPESQHKEVSAFIDRFLLGCPDVETIITRAEMFKEVDYMKWMPWAKE